MSWNPETWTSLGNVPIVGDAWKGITGNPDAIKSAYDKQIAAAQSQQQQLQSFLMARKGQAQGIYGPLQHMYQGAYGTEGVQAPQTPQMPQGGTFAKTYGGAK